MAIEIAADNHIGSNECKKWDKEKFKWYWELCEILQVQGDWEYNDPDDDYFWACQHEADIYYGQEIRDEDDFKNKPVWATHILLVPDGK